MEPVKSAATLSFNEDVRDFIRAAETLRHVLPVRRN